VDAVAVDGDVCVVDVVAVKAPDGGVVSWLLVVCPKVNNGTLASAKTMKSRDG
jgi:hypothetical protein